MFSILLSAFRYTLGFVLRAVVLKFIVFTSAYVVITELVPVIVNQILPASFSQGDKDGGIAVVVKMIPDDIWYFLTVLQMPTGLPLVLGAFLAAFVIRRLHLVR